MRRLAAVLAFAAAALGAAAPAGSDREPGGYAVRLPITPAPGGGAQRVMLPAAVLVALRNRDGSDVRVFDARGRALPIARADATAPARRDELPVSSILGSADAPAGARVSVRLDNRGRPRVAEVESAGGAAAGETVVLGALLDARRIKGSADALVLDLDLPAGQPVRLAVESSGDLDEWRPLGERVLYRASGAAAVPERIALGSAALDRAYLRVRWRADSRLLSPVAVRRAVLVSRANRGADFTVDAQPPALADAHAVEFALPFALPLTSIRITPAPADGPLPVRVLGRDDRERPWTPLGGGIASADGRPIALGERSVRTMRIEADRRTAGFSEPPALRFGLEPRGVAFPASGSPPFTLAAGRTGAPDAFLPIEAVAGPGVADLPAATVAGGAPAPLALAAPDEAGAVRRQALLWAILLGATALLGGMAWLLWRRTPAPAP